MRTLILMRHAKSDWSGTEPDLERPIGKRGRRQAAEAGRWLAEHRPGPDVVLTSPATRAQQTWQVLSEEYGDTSRHRNDDRLYTFDDAGILTVIREIDDLDSALVIGHNPGLDALVTRLTGERVEMVTSALAMLEFEGPWQQLSKARLVAHGRPPS